MYTDLVIHTGILLFLPSIFEAHVSSLCSFFHIKQILINLCFIHYTGCFATGSLTERKKSGPGCVSVFFFNLYQSSQRASHLYLHWRWHIWHWFGQMPLQLLDSLNHQQMKQRINIILAQFLWHVKSRCDFSSPRLSLPQVCRYMYTWYNHNWLLHGPV